MNDLDIKQLKVLHLLLRESNVSKVAHILGISQQAVSEHLRKLRNTFGDQLFIRKSNGLIATPFAESLAPEVGRIINSIEKLVEPKEFNPTTVKSIFRICATDYAQAVVLPKFLASIRSQAPNLKVIVQDIEIDNLSNLMDRGDIDLVISFPRFLPQKYPMATLFTENHKCVVNKKHPRANEIWSIEDVAKHPQLIVSPKRANLVGSADDYFEERGYKRNIVMTLPFFSSTADCVASTDLLAFLPSKLLNHSNLHKVKCDINLPSFDVVIAWHQRSDKDQLNKWVRDKIMEIVY
ncbi:LysR family transcriptional regulator [Thalassotalea eurytherma]|uniref:LysR family transcriptional regulator n=1 Tax=Thalassotalea eurytherma TaxID=1144278 RepID=A0ABQ6H1U7_9GAMM|nr:LysR family transcriptional regulator [Thalassotalea eurytherma]GLX81484.1 LysR family transcriptional regulator [Thalassotalea eurytherma]